MINRFSGAIFHKPQNPLFAKASSSMNRQTLQIGALANCRKGQSVQPTKQQTSNTIPFSPQTVVAEQEWVIVEEKAQEEEKEEAPAAVSKQASSKKELKRTQDEL